MENSSPGRQPMQSDSDTLFQTGGDIAARMAAQPLSLAWSGVSVEIL